ncbi:MAG: hypothetical protein HJJLKODD_00641 [Phycisphaerae bacterium]|nr:hypothetical protein [Phycisphaerae bacterium]
MSPRTLLYFIMVWSLCFAAISTTKASDPAPDDGCGKAEWARRVWEETGQLPDPALLGHRHSMEASSDTDVLHYDLNIEINPATHWLGGSNTIQVRSLVDGLTTFRIRIRSNFSTPLVQVNGVTVTPVRIDTPTLEIPLPAPINAGEEFTVYIEYNGYPVSLGFGSITFTTQGGQPAVYTLSETSYAYTWWPAKDDNTDKATANMRFTVPNNLVVASNGLLQETEVVPGNKLRYHWQTSYPTATYLYCFALTNYHYYADVFSFDGGEMPVVMYIYPQSDNLSNRNAWWKMIDMLGVFSDLYGLYPFIDEKYGMAQFGWSGGMEHQTLTTQGGFWEHVTAHELSHQWWGDMVTCGTWHDIWLNEGFATYSEALWYEFKGPQPDPQARINYMLSSRWPSNVDGTVYVYDLSSLNQIFDSNLTYKKGGWVLHQLRGVLGDEAFFEMLAEYRKAYAYGSAITDDLQEIVEQQTGEPFEWFFEEWLYQPGAPQYQYGWTTHTVGSQNYVELYLNQTQQTAHPTWPIFTMPIEILTASAAGDESETVWNDAATEYLLWPVDEAADDLEFDPNHWILRWTTQEVPMVAGPPKVVSTWPLPKSSIPIYKVRPLQVTFHKNVQVVAADFELRGKSSGVIPCRQSYNPVTFTVTLTPYKPLRPDRYTLTIRDSVEAVDSGMALDGEYQAMHKPAGWPSGDGEAGGAAQLSFSVVKSNILSPVVPYPPMWTPTNTGYRPTIKP